MLSLLEILAVTIRFYTTQQRCSIVRITEVKPIWYLMKQIIELTVQEHCKSLLCWLMFKKIFEINFFWLRKKVIIWFSMLHEGWGNNILNVFCVYFGMRSVCPSSVYTEMPDCKSRCYTSLQCSGGEPYLHRMFLWLDSLPELKLKDCFFGYSDTKDMKHMTG